MCNGFSQCVTDECNCGNDVFHCRNGRECVSLPQVCDRRFDCSDGSDECGCLQYLNCASQTKYLQPIRLCDLSSRARKCDNETVLEVFKPIETKLILHDIIELNDGNELLTYLPYICANDTLRKSFKFHCERITHRRLLKRGNQIVDRNNAYKCEDNTTFLLSLFSYFCDNAPNCKDATDERHCPQYFYCDEGDDMVSLSKVCDGVPNCLDGSDECQNCTLEGISSSRYLVGGLFTSILVVCVALATIGFGSFAFYEHFNKRPLRAAGKIDRLLCLTLTSFDLMISIYLAIIIFKNFQFSNSYCNNDLKWRSSICCKISSFIFLASTIGSLLTTMLMTMSRAYTCVNFFTDVKVRKMVLLVASASFITIATTLTPYFISEYSQFGDGLIATYYFDDNPIATQANKEDLARILSTFDKKYFNHHENIMKDMSGKAILKELNNRLTSNKLLFSKRTLRTVGFYGKTGLCQPNIYSIASDTAQIKLIFFLLYLLPVILIVASYSIIKTISKTDIRTVDEQNRKKEFFLDIKIYVLIICQLIACVPIIIGIIASWLGYKLPYIYHESIAFIVGPANSVLNPILHTSLYSKMFNVLRS